jgi:hypothetical protein
MMMHPLAKKSQDQRSSVFPSKGINGRLISIYAAAILFANKLSKSIVLLLVVIPLFAIASGQNENRTLLSISDVHFNPFCDTLIVKQLVQTSYDRWDTVFTKSKVRTVSAYGQDTNLPLFELLLQALNKQSEGASAILFTGDMLVHNFNMLFSKYTGINSKQEQSKFIYKTLGYISMRLRQTFPDLPIYFSLGNNDSYTGDYAIDDKGKFLSETADLFFNNFIKGKSNSAKIRTEKSDFYSTYPIHGYYNVNSPVLAQSRIIGLNTVFFSTNYALTGQNNPGDDELIWLKKQLAAAEKAKEKVWLLLHIPPGVNVFTTQRNSTSEKVNITMHWKNSYNEKFLELVRRYHATITVLFAGHIHMDDFRLIYSDDKNNKPLAFIHIIPSVAPCFGNNPAFQRIRFNVRSGALTESITYNANLKDTNPDFKEAYVFTSTYKSMPDLTGLQHLYPSLLNDTVRLNNYIVHYSGSSTATGIQNYWQWYWCGIGNLTPEEFTKAYLNLKQPLQK